MQASHGRKVMTFTVSRSFLAYSGIFGQKGVLGKLGITVADAAWGLVRRVQDVLFLDIYSKLHRNFKEHNDYVPGGFSRHMRGYEANALRIAERE